MAAAPLLLLSLSRERSELRSSSMTPIFCGLKLDLFSPHNNSWHLIVNLKSAATKLDAQCSH